MSYESVMPVAEHPGIAESTSIAVGPDQVDPDPLVVVRKKGRPAAVPSSEDETPADAGGPAAPELPG